MFPLVGGIVSIKCAYRADKRPTPVHCWDIEDPPSVPRTSGSITGPRRPAPEWWVDCSSDVVQGTCVGAAVAPGDRIGLGRQVGRPWSWRCGAPSVIALLKVREADSTGQRRRRSAFSFVLHCHGLRGPAKWTAMPVAAVRSLYAAGSVPRSQVSVLRRPGRPPSGRAPTGRAPSAAEQGLVAGPVADPHAGVGQLGLHRAAGCRLGRPVASGLPDDPISPRRTLHPGYFPDRLGPPRTQVVNSSTQQLSSTSD